MKRSIRRLDLASEILLIFLVAGTPLAFGSVEVWATEAMKGGILFFVLLRIVRFRSARKEGTEGTGIGGSGLLAPAVLFVGLVILQLTPVPGALVRLVSPGADRLYSQALPGYPGITDLSRIEEHLLGGASTAPFSIAGQGTAIPPPRRLITLSIYPYATRERLSLLLAYLLLFAAATEYSRDEARRIRLLMAVALTGFFIAAFAFVQKMTWNEKIFWLRPAPPATRPFGPFIDPDHFAGYMELVIPVSVGLLMMIWRLRRSHMREEERPSLQSAAGVISFPRLESEGSRLFAGWGEAAVPKTIFTACALTVAVLAILATRSCGGLIATCVTFALFVGLLVPQHIQRRAVIVASMGLVCLATAVLLAAFGIGPLTAPIAQVSDIGVAPSFASRWMTWREVLRMIADHPLVGTGLGTFREAYTRYYPMGVYSIWAQAHNDYLQLIAETGACGALLLLGGLVRYGRRVFFPALKPGPGREVRLGVAMALVSMGLHSFVDFNLQIPSNGMLTVLLGGVLAGAVPAAQREEEMANAAVRRIAVA